MSYLPCKNPNCNSYGQPHPNCRCHGEMADGGEAGPFCSASRAHKDDCQFFAGGGSVEGEVPEDDLPEEYAAPPAAASPDIGDEVPEDDLPEQTAGDDTAGEVPPEDMPDAEPAQPGSLMQAFTGVNPRQVGAIAEALGRGQLGPIFTGAEVLAGVPAEDIEARRAEMPIATTVAEAASMLAPTSVIGKVASVVGKGSVAAGNLAKFAAGYEELGRVGRGVLKGAGEMMAMQASDEATKAILGHGNPADVVAPFSALGSAAILGALMGGGGSLIGKLAAGAAEKTAAPAARYAHGYVAGLGSAARGEPVMEGAEKAFLAGHKAFANAPAEIAAKIGEASRTTGSHIGGLPGWLVGAVGGKAAGVIAEPFLKKIFQKSGKYGEPTVLRWLESGAKGSVANLENYVRRVEKGESRVNNALDHVFKVGTQKAVDFYHDEKRVDALKKWIDNGGMLPHIDAEAEGDEPDSFAKGGEAKAKPKARLSDDDLHETMPEQAALLSAARGRLSSYLTAQRPPPELGGLAYDGKRDQRKAEKNYRQALEIGVAPLSIMKKIGEGRLLPRDLQHADAMYPELMGMLRQKATDRVMKDHVDGTRPPYKVRQALSLFLGSALASDFTPANIQAAQATFAAKKAASGPAQGSQPPEKRAKNTAPLSKSSRAYLTDEQSREARSQRTG